MPGSRIFRFAKFRDDSYIQLHLVIPEFAKANIRDPERNSERAMYTPVQFKVDEAAEAHALMRAHAFAILITHGADGCGCHPSADRAEGG
jgi:hypothetical protein